MEMSFVGADQVMHVIEELIRSLWSTFLKFGLACPFPRMSYQEAMSCYGSDKPDTRLGMQISRIDHLLPGDLIRKISPLKAPVVESLMLRINQSVLDKSSTMQQFVANFLDSAEGTPFVDNPDGGPGIFVVGSAKPLQGLQALGFEAAERVEDFFQIEDGDLIVLQARQDLPFSGGSTTLGNLRLALHAAAETQGLVKPPIGFAPLWVIDFPLFSPTTENEPGQGGSAGLTATHHPFTSPKSAGDVDMLAVDPRKVIGDHYDLVINGVELGGGSRRIHSAEMQEFVMRQVLKMSPARVAEFSHLLDVLRAGCPPHAGIALGFDRLIALMLGKSSMRDVIAFPKSGRGEDVLVKCPGPLTDEVLKTYFLHIRAPDDQFSV